MLSKEEIRNLAELARLKLSSAEEDALQKDISNILAYVGQVGEAKGEGSLSYSALLNVMREDAPRAEHDPLAKKEERLLAALPEREGGYAVVRKIIDKKES